MKVINAQNVNTAYHKALHYLHEFGITRQSRNGQVLVATEPVTTHYRNPRERVLFSPQRDANPFFHLFEALWMLTGADDIQLPEYFVKRMKTFTDDGKTYHGAYGKRWRRMPSEIQDGEGYSSYIDQLKAIIHLLQANPDDRRIILQIWSADLDLSWDSKDIPCNVTVKFEIAPDVDMVDKLNMIVFNRSNDIIWGCYGANVVQFSVLQEYIASMVGVPVGWYEQISTNFHAYDNVWHDYWPITDAHPFFDPYARTEPALKIESLVDDRDTWDKECTTIISAARETPHIIGDYVTEGMHNRFFHRVCNPMLWAYAEFRAGNLKNAIEWMEKSILESGEIDWLVAGEQWLRRRAAIKMMKGAGV